MKWIIQILVSEYVLQDRIVGFFSSIHTVVYKILADVKLLSDSLAYVKFYMRKLFYSGIKESVIYIFFKYLLKSKKG